MLEKIEVENFKSYNGKCIIGPFTKYTCIVGPNGSGKSNIIDAICFVLCIPIKNLRVSKLSQLINGVNTYMSVTLYINTENELRLKRKIVLREREGKDEKEDSCVVSSYFVNDISKSYSEYLEVLSSLNFFPKIKNFLIFQNDIGCLSLKSSKEILESVEEICGSIEYKPKYEELSKKFNEITLSLGRISDMKKKTLNFIKETKHEQQQQNKIKNLLSLKESRSILLVLANLKIQENSMMNIKEKISELNFEKNILNEKNESKMLEEQKFKTFGLQKEMLKMEEFKNINLEKIKNITKFYEELCGSEILKEKNENEIYAKKSKIKFYLHEKYKEVEKCKNELVYIEESFKKVMENNEEKRKKKEFYIEKYGDIFNECEDLFLQKCRNNLREFKEEEMEIYSLKDQIKKFKIKLEIINKEISKFDKEKDFLGFEENLEEKLNLLKKNKENIFLKIKTDLKKVEELENKEIEFNNQLNILMKKIMDLKVFKIEGDKRTKMRLFVKTLQQINSSVYGEFNNFIEVSQKKYEKGIGLLMKGNEYSVVVENDEVAIDCVNYVKEYNKKYFGTKVGRITFLPLKEIKGRHVKGEFRNLSGAVPAIDTLIYDSKYKNVVEYVFEDGIIAENLELAKDLVYEKKIKTRVVTHDGVLFNLNGTITGSSSKSFFEEKDNSISELLFERNKILDSLKTIYDSKQNLSHIEIFREKINNFDLKIEETEKLILEKNEKRKLETEKINKLNENKKELESLIQEKENSLNLLEHKIEKNQKRIKKYENKIFIPFLEKSKITVEEFRNLQEDLNDFYLKSDYKNKRKEIEIKLDLIKDEINKFQSKLNELENESMFKFIIPQSIIDSVDINQEMEIKTVINILETFISKYQIENINYTTEIQKLKEKFLIEKNKFEFMNKKITDFLEKNKFNRIRKRLENLRMALLDEINIPILEGNLNEYKKDLIVDYSILENELQNSNLKSTQNFDNENFGNINENKIENNKENYENETISTKEIINDTSKYNILKNMLSDELKEITKQLDLFIPLVKNNNSNLESNLSDLNEEHSKIKFEWQKTKEDLKNIKNQRQEIFMNCFNKINNSITRIYKELTKSESEGSAYLILENTDDPFKEGIKYHVMPPRKRFREIKDLSGGEQSIASLALLFAIREYKPSLFYIFDEIDAPLDKFNVFKLSQYFENFPTQKIIVTHKINLFQFSESLIGVYKNKEGVSKTLSYSNKGVLNFSSLIGYTSSSKGVLNYN
ncbi:SMC-like chromosome segregation protein [Hamiltosporidium tvaerminnensis]|uniref:Structural maintenance of chromosomes protein n=1 Tax=Hamiltosporidium tvaerminnensis TaxID=1176355 RepID=A0A4Q9LR13_9MICR|nr:SMC-like chromosome segregation protein [Hamiltosporidium tvaerminnensis]